MSTFVFPSISLLVLHGTVVARKQIFRDALHLKIFSQCPTAFISSWKESNVEMRNIKNKSRFLLEKNQISEINIWLLPPHCLVLLSIDALSPQKGTYKVHFVSRVLKKNVISNHHISHLALRVDWFWRAVAAVLRGWQNKKRLFTCLVWYM